MNDVMLREKFGHIEQSLDRLRVEINPDLKIEKDVQHSIIWAITLILLSLIIKWMIVS